MADETLRDNHSHSDNHNNNTDYRLILTLSARKHGRRFRVAFSISFVLGKIGHFCANIKVGFYIGYINMYYNMHLYLEQLFVYNTMLYIIIVIDSIVYIVL